MFQCKTSQQPIIDEQKTAITDTIQKDCLQVELLSPQDTVKQDSTPLKLTSRQLQLIKIEEKISFFQSLQKEKKINLKYSGKLLRKGDSTIAIIPIKRKLRLLGLLEQDSLTIHFDSSMEAAVKNFQQMHNIRPDGIPGRNTFRFLSWPISKYINALEVHHKRIKKQADSLPSKRIEINIPEYKLRFFINDTVVQSFDVIVGKYKKRTPLLTSKIDYLVFNPCWTVPHRIAVKSMLPKLKKDTSYLDNRNMFITQNGETRDHRKIDFSQYNKTNFPYKIFQNASPGNALGQVKFMFENSHLVYLHDTPSKYLFNKDFRTFSSGCIRVNHAMQLAELMLDTDQNPTIIKNKLAKGYPVKVYLNNPLPIIIKYETARYNEQFDLVQYFYDCYGLDK